MGSIRLGVGTEWLLEGRAFRVIRQLGPQQFVAEDLTFRVEQILSEATILKAFADGKLRFPVQERESMEDSASASPIAADPDALTIAAKRWQAIEPLTRLGRRPSEADYAERVRELTGTSVVCSTRSLQRWFQHWKKSGQDRRRLAPRVTDCGKRGQKRKNSLLARYPAVRQFVDQAIREVYLSTARRPISAVARRVLEDLQWHNARTSAALALPVPKYGSLARAVARLIGQLDPYEVDRARWGRRIADQRHQSTARQRLATRILERVEIDHSPLKVVVGTEAGPIGQPWLTILLSPA